MTHAKSLRNVRQFLARWQLRCSLPFLIDKHLTLADENRKSFFNREKEEDGNLRKNTFFVYIGLQYSLANISIALN